VGDFLKDVSKQSMILAGVVGGALVVGAKTSIDAFNEADAIMKQTEAVLKSTGGVAGMTKDSILRLSSEIQKTTTVSDDGAQSIANLALTFTNISKNVFPDTIRAAIDMATAMNGGITPAAEVVRDKMMLIGKAMQDPDAGLGALHRVGVNVEELAKTFKNLSTIEEKQKAILKELGTEFGGSAPAAAETFGGKVKQLQNDINNLQEVIGEFLVSYLTPMFDAINSFVNSSTFNKYMEIVLTDIDNFVASLKPLGEWISTHQELVLTFLKGLGIALIVLLVIGTITALLTALLNPLVLVAAAVTALYMAWEANFLGIRDITTVWVDNIKKEFEIIVNALKWAGDQIYNNLVRPFQDAWGRISDLVNKIKNALDFTQRHSPSIIDIVENGVALVNRAFSDLKMPAISPVINTPAAMNLSGQQLNHISIDLSGALISDVQTADKIGERVGNAIIRKLQTNIRF